MHLVGTIFSGVRTLFTTSTPTLQDAIVCNDSGAVRAHLIKKGPLSLDEFSQICFHMPCLVRIVLPNYPEHVKKAPFSLLLSLAKKKHPSRRGLSCTTK